MLSRASTTVLRRCGPALTRSAATAVSARAPSAAASPYAVSHARSFSSAIEENLSASDAWKKSCYVQIEYTISEDATVYDAIQRFAAYDIGCLVTVNSDGVFA